MDISTAAAIVLPVFGLIALGYGSALAGILREEVGEAVGQFVFTIAIPILLFKSLANAEMGDVSPWPLFLTYFSGVTVTWLMADQIVRRVFGRDKAAGIVAGVSSAFSNTVLIGIPFVLSAYGPEGMVPLFLLLSVHLPTMMSVGTILFARVEGGSATETVKKIGHSLIRNPIIIGIIAGGLWRLTGVKLQGIPLTFLDMIAAASVPCALFSMGMGLRTFSIRGNITPAILLSLLKAVVMPLIVYLLARYVTHMPPLWVAVVTLLAACPTGINAWLFANHFKTGHALSANTITMTTGLSFLTMTGWLIFLHG